MLVQPPFPSPGGLAGVWTHPMPPVKNLEPKQVSGKSKILWERSALQSRMTGKILESNMSAHVVEYYTVNKNNIFEVFQNKEKRPWSNIKHSQQWTYSQEILVFKLHLVRKNLQRLLSFFNVYWFWEREERMSGGGGRERERERERDNPKQAPLCQCRARLGLKLWEHNLGQN